MVEMTLVLPRFHHATTGKRIAGLNFFYFISIVTMLELHIQHGQKFLRRTFWAFNLSTFWALRLLLHETGRI